MKHRHHIIPKHMWTKCNENCPGYSKRQAKHNCGLDDSSNVVLLTVEEHAAAHKLLYEQYGLEEDKLAWEGLAGIIGHEEAVHRSLSLASKKRKVARGKDHPFYGKKRPDHSAKMKGRKPNRSPEHQAKLNAIFASAEHQAKIIDGVARDWEIKTPTGEIIVIHNLSKFCRENNLSKSSMHYRGCKGYKAIKLGKVTS